VRTIRDLLDLTGRKAIVTGGAGHIGKEICKGLADLGGTVSVMDVSETADLKCDLTDENSTRTAVRNGIKKMEGLDILIHCAAYVADSDLTGWAVPFEDQEVKAWDLAMRVNLTAAFVIAQEAKEALEQSGYGSIILFSSIYGMVGPDFKLYDKTKMASF